MEQPVQTIQRLNAFGGVGFTGQQRCQIDAGELRQQMSETDEAAEHAVAVESIGEVSMPRAPDQVALVPVCARIGVEQEPKPLAIQGGIGGRGGLAEELPELGVVGT